jgi:signal transduction histidine kinase
LIYVDSQNIIRYDSERKLIGIAFDKVSFFETGGDGNVTITVDKSSLSMFETEVVKGGVAYGRLIFLPDIDIKDAYAFFTYLPFVIVGVFILSIFTMIIILSKLLSDGILKPLKELNHAAEMISSGDLDYEMNYKKDDEIGKFCNEFDKMRLRLKDSLEKQVEFEHSRQQLIASVSHDLKTPLTSIQGYVELLGDDIIEDPATQKVYLDIIHSKSQQLNHLIDDLFTFSRMNLDEFQIELSPADSRSLFEFMLSEKEMDFQDKPVELRVERPIPSVPLSVDAPRLHQVLDNLISNAEKFTKSYIHIYTRVLPGVFEWFVEDDGIGIPQEDLSRIFDHFFKVDKSRTYSNRGTGLGLAICKQIIEAHGGTISVRSQLNEGTTFKVKLPIVQTTSETHPALPDTTPSEEDASASNN